MIRRFEGSVRFFEHFSDVGREREERNHVRPGAAPCASANDWCTELRVGASDSASAVVARYTDPSATCDEVVWTPDGKRVGFVIRGHELRLFDPQSGKEIGTVRLVTEEAAQTRRARGVTFSENGRAVTFDDCPRTHSGCRAGVVGVPQ